MNWWWNEKETGAPGAGSGSKESIVGKKGGAGQEVGGETVFLMRVRGIRSTWKRKIISGLIATSK